MLKIFVSHSSVDSVLVERLRELISGIFEESIQLLYSSSSVEAGGIAAGESWLDWIREQVKQSAMTIVILTPLSKTRPWLMWEAGAVTGAGISQGASVPIVPLLFGMGIDDVPSPLRERQFKFGTRDKDVNDLLGSIRRLGDLHYTNTKQSIVNNYIEQINRIGIPEMHDLFISCPMTSFKEEEFYKLREVIDELFNLLKQKNYKIYCSLLKNRDRQFDPESISAENDLVALKMSRNFLMIYPKKIISSCLLEAGYALINGTRSSYFVRNNEDLPYILRGVPNEAFPKVKLFRFKEDMEIVDKVNKHIDQIIM